MKRTPRIITRVLAFLLLGAIVLVVWRSIAIKEFKSNLQGGYFIAKTDTNDGIAICDAKGAMVIRPTVTLVGLAGHFIVGRVDLPRSAFYQEFGGKPGYFMVDTMTAEVSEGMSEAECAARLEEHHLTWPRMYHPNDWYLRHFGR